MNNDRDHGWKRRRTGGPDMEDHKKHAGSPGQAMGKGLILGI